jgi:hypothetical protein
MIQIVVSVYHALRRFRRVVPSDLLFSSTFVLSYTECGQKGHNATAEPKGSFSGVTLHRFQQRTRQAKLLANRP